MPSETPPFRSPEDLLLCLYRGGVLRDGLLNGAPVDPALTQAALRAGHICQEDERTYLTPEGEGHLRAAYFNAREAMPEKRIVSPALSPVSQALLWELERGAVVTVLPTGAAVLMRGAARVRTLTRAVVHDLRQRGLIRLTELRDGPLVISAAGRVALHPKGIAPPGTPYAHLVDASPRRSYASSRAAPSRYTDRER